MEKKKMTASALLLMLPLTLLPALSFSAGGSVASKYTDLDGWVWPVAVHGSVEDFEFGLNVSEDHTMDTALYWRYKGPHGFAMDLGSSWHQRWSSGGFWTLTGAFGQDFPFESGWYVDYRLGLELSASWSPYSPDFVSPGFSPYIVLEGGWKNDLFSVGAYFTSEKMFEKTHQTLPIVGASFGWNVTAHNNLTLDCYYKVADYMAQPDRLMTDAEFRLYWTYRGETI